MINAGINSGDMLVVDRSIEPEGLKVVIASVNNELVVKRLVIRDGRTILRSENENYTDIHIKQADDFEIWGVVTSVIKAC